MVAVSKHEEYLANAAECARMARNSREESERRTWQQMADSWTEMAKAQEGKSTNQELNPKQRNSG